MKNKERSIYDHGSPEYLDGAQMQFTVEEGKPYPHGDSIAYCAKKSDALLLVAAPDLLAALKRIVLETEVYGTIGPLDQARAAILKAKGGAK
jgi:hypothetical protein